MRRKIEFLFYALAILFMIARYNTVGDREAPPRRPAPEPFVQQPRGLEDEDRLPPAQEGSVHVTLDPEVRNGMGTGFATGSGIFVTARHVVDGCQGVYLVRGNEAIAKAVVHIVPGRDFAVLEAKSVTPPIVALYDHAPSRGTEGYMMGFPQSKPADVRAVVMGASEMRSHGRYEAAEPVLAWVERERRPSFMGELGGISGGPVFNAAGFVVGTVVASSPRRGRVYTTHPKVFADQQLINTRSRAAFVLGQDNFDVIGRRFRDQGTILQVYCKAA